MKKNDLFKAIIRANTLSSKHLNLPSASQSLYGIEQAGKRLGPFTATEITNAGVSTQYKQLDAEGNLVTVCRFFSHNHFRIMPVNGQ